jgi:hypothetical protein
MKIFTIHIAHIKYTISEKFHPLLSHGPERVKHFNTLLQIVFHKNIKNKYETDKLLRMKVLIK